MLKTEQKDYLITIIDHRPTVPQLIDSLIINGTSAEIAKYMQSLYQDYKVTISNEISEHDTEIIVARYYNCMNWPALQAVAKPLQCIRREILPLNQNTANTSPMLITVSQYFSNRAYNALVRGLYYTPLHDLWLDAITLKHIQQTITKTQLRKFHGIGKASYDCIINTMQDLGYPLYD